MQSYNTKVFSSKEGSIVAANDSYNENEYIKLDWIASTKGGGQWIETGLYALEHDVIKFKCTYDQDTAGSLNIIGTTYNHRIRKIGITHHYFYASGGVYNEDYSGNYSQQGTPVAPSDLLPHTFIYDYDRNSLTIDDIEYPLAGGLNYSNRLPPGEHLGWTMVIFGNRMQEQIGVINGLIAIKLESMQIFHDGVLIRDYEPRLLLKTGKPGLYDKVNNTFSINLGTKEFEYELNTYNEKLFSSATNPVFVGNDSIPENQYIKLKYIAATGSSAETGKQWLETGIYGEKHDIITIKGSFDQVPTSGTCYLIGHHRSGRYRRIGIYNGAFFAAGGVWSEKDIAGTLGSGHIGSYVCPADTKEHTFIYNYDRNSLTIDSTEYALAGGLNYADRDAPTANPSMGNTMPIFVYRHDSYTQVSGLPYFKLESFKMTRSGIILCDYEPRLQLKTGKPGLYNKVNGLFLVNQGSNEFAYEIENYNIIIEET